jgi:hypothetical protein
MGIHFRPNENDSTGAPIAAIRIVDPIPENDRYEDMACRQHFCRLSGFILHSSGSAGLTSLLY